jgi:hypothetical protein
MKNNKRSQFDDNFEQMQEKHDKLFTVVSVGAVVSAIVSMAFVGAVIWAIVKVVQHYVP